MAGPLSVLRRGRRFAASRVGRTAARVVPSSVAAGSLLRALRASPDLVPPGAVGLAYELTRRLRCLPDEQHANRWLHHRWLAIFDEMWTDLRALGLAPSRPGFSYLCLGPGAINPYGFSLLVFLAGASEVRLVEPERPPRQEEWREWWGLEELTLRLLTGSVDADARDLDVSRIDMFVDLDALFFGGRGRDPLKRERVQVLWTGLEDAELPAASADLVTSRSVLEHVMRFEEFSDSLASVVRSGGVVYHDIDLTAHSERDRFEFYYSAQPSTALNELRLPDHIAALESRGFKTTVLRAAGAEDYTLDRTRLAERFQHYRDEDLLVTRAVLVARRPE